MSAVKTLQSPLGLSALTTFIVGVWLFSWQSQTFKGDPWGSLRPTRLWAEPHQKAHQDANGIPEIGWDGQFYYRLSQSPFVLEKQEFIDVPAYRWQRVGMPLVSHLVSRILFMSTVPPWLYHGVQLFFMGLGIFFFAHLMLQLGFSPLWALPWVFSLGSIQSLFLAFPIFPPMRS